MTTEAQTTTAVVKIQPELAQSYVALRDEASKMVAYAEAMQVSSPESVAKATQDLSMTANLKKALETLRRSYVDPLNTHVKDINEVFKPITTQVGEADRTIRDKIDAYNSRQREIAAEAARIEALRKEAEEAAAKLAAETGAAPEPPPPPAAPLPASREVRAVDTAAGSLNTRADRKWRLLDKAQVPEKYKILDEVTINRLVRGGIDEIPGIEIYVKDTIVVRSKHGPAPAATPTPEADDGDLPFK